MAIRLSSENRVYAFARGMAPAATVDAGETVILEARDCYDGQVDLTRTPLSADGADGSLCNPATGPVFVRGAMPGDMLCATIEKIDVAPVGLIFGSNRDWTYSAGMAVHIEDGKAALPGGHRVPIEPVIGVIGVAPSGDDAIPNSTPGDHGGNLDTPDVRTGSTVYLPVAEEGGLFGVGDIHALQGDGEVCGQGIEIAGSVTVRLQVMKGTLGPGPVIDAGGHWAVVASAETLDEASDIALLRARDFVMARTGVKDHEAIMLLSTVCDLRISQIVNPLKTVRVCIPKRIAGAW